MLHQRRRYIGPESGVSFAWSSEWLPQPAFPGEQSFADTSYTPNNYKNPPQTISRRNGICSPLQVAWQYYWLIANQPICGSGSVGDIERSRRRSSPQFQIPLIEAVPISGVVQSRGQLRLDFFTRPTSLLSPARRCEENPSPSLPLKNRRKEQERNVARKRLTHSWTRNNRRKQPNFPKRTAVLCYWPVFSA